MRPEETGCERREAVGGCASSADGFCEEVICTFAVEDDCVVVMDLMGPSAGGWSEPGQGADRGPCR
jgi:hypothetical protein